MEEKNFKKRTEIILEQLKGMPYYQWQQISHSVEREYNSEFSKQQSQQILENPEHILSELRMFFY